MNWTKAWLRRRRWERRMDAELRFHLESQIDDYLAQGLSRPEAERRARLDFGPLDLTREECRDQRPAEWLHTLQRDLRLAARALLRTPAFALAAVAALALGIGANTAVSSAVYTALLRPLPYHQPDRIYALDLVIPERAAQFPSLPAPIQAFLEWRRHAASPDAITALRPWEANLSGDGEPERLGGARVAANFFTFLGAPIARGRGFTPADEQPGNERVIVISDALWRRRYGADPAVLGRTVAVNGDPHTIIGIAAPHLLVPVQTQLHPLLPFAPRIDLWKPIAPTPRELKGESWDHGILVRLAPGQSPEPAAAEFGSALSALIKIDVRAQLKPIREVYAGNIRLRLLLVLAASALLLLTACANVANLFLARAATRSAEFATRVALGAGRARILSHVLAEALLVSLCGAALGTATAFLGARALGAAAALHPVMLLTALAAGILTAFVCAALPAWNVFRRDTVAGLREGARSALGSGIRTRQVLVGVQIALGTLLLASTALLLRSFVNVMSADRGYSVDRVLAVDLSLFGQTHDPASFYRNLTAKVQALPQVQSAGVINDLPATAGSSGASRTVFLPGDSDFQQVVLQRPVAMVRSITPGYLAASGTALRAGRGFQDQEPQPVALVSESLAKALWPQDPVEAAVGRSLRQGNVTGPLITVVGVVQNVRAGAPDRDLPPFIYRPYPQWASGPATLVVRSDESPSALASAIRAEIRRLHPTLPIPPMRTLREIVSESVAQRRFQLLLTALFAAIAVLLGAVGVFGVVSYAVACRAREIGLRLALGATTESIQRWVIVTALRPVLIGITAGLSAAIAAASLIRGLLYGVTPFDPLSATAVIALLLACSALASYLPARRAARLDPMAALRCE
ncbi:MAG: ADOP family duplicated permease [Bryobacteraceae bacterium]|nr:ADOP family duplicated permease [Bryobacteraceae bacterium]